MDRPRKKKVVFTAVYFLLLLFLMLTYVFVRASSTVTLVTGGSSISADTAGLVYTTLIGPVISEGVTADIGVGTIILNAPAGFVFDTSGTSPKVVVTWLGGGTGVNGNNINNKGNGASTNVSARTTTQMTFNITAPTEGSAINSLTWQNIRVRPTAGTPLASGNIVKTGTSVIAGITNSVTNLGTLTEVAGVKTQLAFTTQPSTTATTDLDFTVKPVIAVKDQFGNTVSSDSTTMIAYIDVLSTQVCGGTVGTGTLTSTPANAATVTNGIMSYSAMQYSFGESIKICMSSSGLDSVLSDTISVSNPIPTTTSISPTDKDAFASTFTLTVNGSNFVENSVVRFEGSDRITTYISDTELTASILATDLTSVGTFDITVFNPSLGGGISNTQTLTVNNPLPVVSNISPESKVAGSGEFILTVNGSNFLTDSVVRFSGSDRTTVFVDATQLTATILADDILIDGVFPITVFNSAPGGGISDAVSFTVSAIPPPPDTTPPAAISDLALADETIDSIKLTWTAPGDDGNVGAATSYDIRYSTSLIDDGNWASATEVLGEPSPSVAGTVQDTTVTGLSSETEYFFAIKTSDGIPNTSDLSNVPSLSTAIPPDITAPAAVSDLVLSEATTSSIKLTWTAPGDDADVGTATSYRIRYSTALINDGNWADATDVIGEPSPALAGTVQDITVTGLSSETTYFFGLKTDDEVSNLSPLSNIPSLATIISLDIIAPSTINDLALSGATASSINLNWTSPGDDGAVGIANNYDIRYSTLAITVDNFSLATAVSGEPSPQIAGSFQSMTVSGLSANTNYFFAIQTADEAPNMSIISNVPSLSTLISSETPTPVPSSGGGGVSTSVNTITFSGQAYPASTIDLLRASITSRLYQNIVPSFISIKENGAFEIKQDDIPNTEYLYALQINDKDGRKTNLFFDVDFISKNNFSIKNIFVPPSLGLIKTLLTRADDLQLVGYTAPATIIELDIDGLIQKETATSDINGYYKITISGVSLSVGTHYIKVRQINNSGIKSDWSMTKVFKKSLLSTSLANFNDDGVVNITDWSIFLFRWESLDQNLRSTIDLDGNGIIDIFDFSIFLKLLIL